VVLWTKIGFPGRLEEETTTQTSGSPLLHDMMHSARHLFTHKSCNIGHAGNVKMHLFSRTFTISPRMGHLISAHGTIFSHPHSDIPPIRGPSESTLVIASRNISLSNISTWKLIPRSTRKPKQPLTATSKYNTLRKDP